MLKLSRIYVWFFYLHQSFLDHINSIINKVCTERMDLSSEILVIALTSIYFAYSGSHLEYSSIIWYPFHRCYLNWNEPLPLKSGKICSLSTFHCLIWGFYFEYDKEMFISHSKNDCDEILDQLNFCILHKQIFDIKSPYNIQKLIWIFI